MSIAVEAPVQTWFARSRGWIGIVILVPFSVLMLLSIPLSLEGSWVDFVFDQAAWLLFFAGAAFRWWSTLYIGGRKTAELIQEGPYSLCRNPLYLGTFLMVLSAAVFLESLTFAIGLVLASWVYLSTTVPVEERRLRNRFGKAFDEYCQRVPRFFPRPGSFRSADTVQVRVGGLLSEGIRAARWIWLPIVCLLIVQLRSQPNWPHLFHLP
ncbi:MAG TPA: isoprenylcysteine carboxylmethyltransferase family protein [Pirellulales bacterium]|nr:isoprenylcysteine carboxylmethyltransferase family protein [Pirellulales bacterium]